VHPCIADEDLVLLGDNACVGAGAYVAAHELTRNGKFKRGLIVVGADCLVGPGARLTPNVTMEASSSIPALACALPGQTFIARKATAKATEAEAGKLRLCGQPPPPEVTRSLVQVRLSPAGHVTHDLRNGMVLCILHVHVHVHVRPRDACAMYPTLTRCKWS